MFIEPNSTLVLYRNVNLDREHHHTIYFENREAQDIYFGGPSNVVYTFFQYSYIRETKTIRVGLDAINGIYYGDLYRCNYLRFKNTSYYDKWFYAFIDKIEYVNNNCAEIYFTIDPMQTWLIGVDWISDDCYIEREHSVTDNIGDNLIEEGLELGDYVYGEKVPMLAWDGQSEIRINLTNLSLVLAFAEKLVITREGGRLTVNTEPLQATYWGDNNVSALHYTVFPNTVTGIEEFNAVMKVLNNLGKTEEIFAIFWFPTRFIDSVVMNEGEIPDPYSSWSTFGNKIAWDVSVKTQLKAHPNDLQNNIDGYVPKNNKLFTYPYNFLYAISPNQHCVYKYEYFLNGIGANNSEGNCNFTLYGAVSPNATIQCFPNVYKNSSTGSLLEGKTEDEAIALGGFPLVLYNTDVAKAYTAQWNAGWQSRIGSWALGLGGALLNIAAANGARNAGAAGDTGGRYSFSSHAAVSAVTSPLQEIAAYNMRKQALEVAPNKTNGGCSDVTSLQSETMDIQFINKHIRAEFAKIIDDYFTMFGYASHRVGRINPHVRRYFTYVKTIGSHISGAFPRDVEEEICKILDNGITFWAYDANIGDYSVNNQPLNP